MWVRTLLHFLPILACLTCTPLRAPVGTDTAELTIDDAFAPNLLTLADGSVILTVLEETSEGHRLLLSRIEDELPVQQRIAEGPDFFANWADVPGLVEAGDGSLIAHWLEQAGPETYDYGIKLARSTDGGATWTSLDWLNDDAWGASEDEAISGEHGFVAWVPEGGGARAFWLDARAAAGHGDDGHGGAGAMQLRTTTVVDGQIAPSELLDDRVCDCCPNAAIQTPNGPLVAFRDRSEDEIRDIHILRYTADDWQRTVIDTSGWQIPGCPVNGPALAAEGDRVLVGWYTAHPEPRVYAAWSEDAGTTFGEPILLTTDTLGRVSAAILDGEGSVAWLSSVMDSAVAADAESLPPGEVRLVRLRPDGVIASPISVATTAATRRAGIPKLAVQADQVGLAWTEVLVTGENEQSTRIGYATMPGTSQLAPVQSAGSSDSLPSNASR